MPEVEVDVLAIVLSADAFFEEDPVCGDFEEIGVVGEVFGSILFGTELECDALRLKMLDLLVGCEQGLALLDAVGFRYSFSSRFDVRAIIQAS